MLSKSDKNQLIEIEKCERMAMKNKLLDSLQKRRDRIIAPFNDKIKKLTQEKDAKLTEAGLFYISEGCGRTHPEIEAFNLETNNRIKAILRE